MGGKSKEYMRGYRESRSGSSSSSIVRSLKGLGLSDVHAHGSRSNIIRARLKDGDGAYYDFEIDKYSNDNYGLAIYSGVNYANGEKDYQYLNSESFGSFGELRNFLKRTYWL